MRYLRPGKLVLYVLTGTIFLTDGVHCQEVEPKSLVFMQYLRSLWLLLWSLLTGSNPPKPPLGSPVAAPTPVTQPIASPVSAPVKTAPIPAGRPISFPIEAPIPVLRPFSIPVPGPTPLLFPVPAPKVPAPVSSPQAIPISVPIALPVPMAVPIAAPKVASLPILAPISVPVPAPSPIPPPKEAPFPASSPLALPVDMIAPIAPPKAIPVPNFTPKAVPVPAPVTLPTPKAAPVPVPSTFAPPLPNTTPSPPISRVAVFYTHGDVPYSPEQALLLEAQMNNIPLDAEFIVFVGDLRKAGVNNTCRLTEYQNVSRMFRLSPVPVFVIIGDNDAADCPNKNEGLQFWNQEFIQFETRYWTHNFVIRRQDGYPDNFAFVHKNVLFIGLNIIGGQTQNAMEWELRLSAEAMWTMDLIREYRQLLSQASAGTAVGRVVLFGHADPGSRHAPFFQSMSTFIQTELQNSIPILYINGDKHEWTFTPNFYSRPSWLRVGVTGLAKDPLLKVTVDGNGASVNPEQTFSIDRRLP